MICCPFTVEQSNLESNYILEKLRFFEDVAK